MSKVETRAEYGTGVLGGQREEVGGVQVALKDISI